MENFFLSPAVDDCNFANYKEVVKHFCTIRSSFKEVELSVIVLEDEIEPLWFSCDEKSIMVYPAFKGGHSPNISESDLIDGLPIIDPGTYFFKNSNLYFFDYDKEIYKVTAIWEENLALLFARCRQITPTNCVLANLFLQETFIATAWIIDEKESANKTVVSVFPEEKKKIIDCFEAKQRLTARTVEEGELLCHGSNLWIIVDDEQSGLHLEPTLAGKRIKRCYN